jgi:hypothetical protein
MNLASIVYLVLIWLVFITGSYLAIYTMLPHDPRKTRAGRAHYARIARHRRATR